MFHMINFFPAQYTLQFLQTIMNNLTTFNTVAALGQ